MSDASTGSLVLYECRILYLLLHTRSIEESLKVFVRDKRQLYKSARRQRGEHLRSRQTRNRRSRHRGKHLRNRHRGKHLRSRHRGKHLRNRQREMKLHEREESENQHENRS